MSLQRGNLCEAMVATKLLELGYSVSFPFGGGSPYDLIVDREGVLLKVQVKSTAYDGTRSGKRERIVLTRHSKGGKSHRPYRSEDVDCFVVVTRAKEFYVIPFDDAASINRAGIGVEARVKKYLEAWELLAI